MSTGQKPEGATPIFVLGLLGITQSCAPLGIIAWIWGNRYMDDCRQMGVEPDQLAVVGRILGMIASILLIVSLTLVPLFLCIGFLAMGLG